MSLLVLSAEDVSAVTSELKLEELEALMASVFHRLSSGSDYASPHRTSISMPRHTTLFMPSRVPDLGTTIKVVSVPMSGGDKQGLPASTIVLDETTGCVKAIVNASTLTALRTASGASYSGRRP
jgi:ornithine cyclodeaminase/alanine dehydrogenase-like protein (mu-crystallin family)